jgi:hypothetical protein
MLYPLGSGGQILWIGTDDAEKERIIFFQLSMKVIKFVAMGPK